MSLLSDIPGYKEAVSREQHLREAAYLSDLTVLSTGMRVALFTPRLYLQAYHAQSPFFHGGDLFPEHVLRQQVPTVEEWGLRVVSLQVQAWGKQRHAHAGGQHGKIRQVGRLPQVLLARD